MQRMLNYPYELTKCCLKDRYGNTRAETLLTQGTNPLEISPQGFYYQTHKGFKFFCYEGDGVLDFAHAQKGYDFSRVDSSNIDKALFFGTTQGLNQSEKEFLELLEINLSKGANYLIPPRFLEIQQEILSGDFN